jgi:hypothetical protein
MILAVRACIPTIRRYPTNQTDSQNAGALPGPQVRMRQPSGEWSSTARAWPASAARGNDAGGPSSRGAISATSRGTLQHARVQVNAGDPLGQGQRRGVKLTRGRLVPVGVQADRPHLRQQQVRLDAHGRASAASTH